MTTNLYNIPNYSPLVEVIDSQKGYVLLKNLCPHSDRYYSVAVKSDDDKSLIMPNPPNETWVTANQADEIMQNILNNPLYNKATKDDLAESF